MVRTREHAGEMTVGTAEAVWPDAVAPEVLRRIVITTPNARFDVDPRTSRFLVLEKARASTGPDLRSPVVVFGLDRDRRPTRAQ